MRSILVAALAGLAMIGTSALTATSAQATPILYDFDVTFDGTSATQDITSDPIAGTNLAVGDFFNLDIHAASNDFWNVDSSFVSSLVATFVTVESASRIGNATTTLFLDGVQITQRVELGIGQSAVHIGNQSFSFVAGMQFDQLVVSYELLASSSLSSTIVGIPDIITFNPFFRSSRISYIQGSTSEIPEPGTLAIFGLGLLGMAATRRQRRRTA